MAIRFLRGFFFFAVSGALLASIAAAGTVSYPAPTPAAPARGLLAKSLGPQGVPMGMAAAAVPPTPTRSASSAPAAVPVASFEGLAFGPNGPYGNEVAPPDAQVAAGPRHVVELVNLVGRVWTKNGTAVQTFPLHTFFGATSTDFISDPKVRYDERSGRWFASITDVTTSAILLAVSMSDDPTGRWSIRSFGASASCADQPLLGLSDDKVILSANDYASCAASNPSFVGVEYWIINKADLLAGATPRFQRFGPDSAMFSLQPAHGIGSAETAYLATAGSGSSTSLTVLAVSGVPPGPVSVVSKSLSITPTVAPPAAPQAGTALLLDASDARVQDAIWDSGHLWAVLGDACVPSGDLLTRSCIRLIDVDTTTFGMVQDFDFGMNGKSVFYPAIRTEGDGRLSVVFGASSVTDYPSAMIVSRSASDPPGQLGAPTLLMGGTGPETSACTATQCRYGDYFGAARDPSDPGVVWVAAEYGRPSGWGTFVAAIATTVHIRVSYSVRNGGSGYQPPEFAYVEGGLSKTIVVTTTPMLVAVDAGSRWSIPDALGGSGSTERWATQGLTSGPALGFEPMEFTYTHQYLASFDYRVSGGGSGYSAPRVDYTKHGASLSSSANVTDWVDAGSAYAYPMALDGSNETERWQADSTAASGLVSRSGSIVVPYRHQAFGRLEVQGPAGASVSPDTGWFDVGTTVEPTVQAPAGWAVGEWEGTGIGAYSGTTAVPRITVAGPFAETAILFPGLTISSGVGSSVSYTYGSVSGTIAGGTSRTIYVRPGTNVSLTTADSTWFAFSGWSGTASGKETHLVLRVDQPQTLTASFALTGLAVTVVASGVAGTGFLVATLVVVVRRGRRRARPPAP